MVLFFKIQCIFKVIDSSKATIDVDFDVQPVTENFAHEK
jgi:hypothetical protein